MPRPSTIAHFYAHSYAPYNPQRPRTRKGYSQAIAEFSAHLTAGNSRRAARLDELTDANLAAAMQATIDRGNSTATANKLRRHLLTIWNAAIAAGQLTKPCRVKPYPKAKHERRTWDADEFQRILDAASDLDGWVGEITAHAWWTALLFTIGNTGGRVSAVMSAATADLDTARGDLLLKADNQKQNADQRFALAAETLDAIAATRPGDRRQLFPWPYDDNAATNGDWKTLTRHYKRILKAAGLRTGRTDLFHSLRAMVATWIADAQGIDAARDYLGHSDNRVTAAYLDRSQMSTRRDARAVLPIFKTETEAPIRLATGTGD